MSSLAKRRTLRGSAPAPCSLTHSQARGTAGRPSVGAVQILPPLGRSLADASSCDLAGFKVLRHQKGNENGYCDFVKKEIGVRPDVEPLQAAKTLIHELAHALLHAEDQTAERARQEVEVESVAFVVLDALGLASNDYSFPYVTRWSHGDLDLVKQSAERAISCATQVLTAVTEAPNKLVPCASE